MKYLLISLFICATYFTSAKNNITIHKIKQNTKDSIPSFKTDLQQKPLEYKVQIGAFKTRNKALEKLRNISIYIDENLYKYRLGEFKTYKAANAYKNVVKKHYPSAFVQALRGGLEIKILDAIKEEKGI